MRKIKLAVIAAFLICLNLSLAGCSNHTDNLKDNIINGYDNWMQQFSKNALYSFFAGHMIILMFTGNPSIFPVAVSDRKSYMKIRTEYTCSIISEDKHAFMLFQSCLILLQNVLDFQIRPVSP